MSQTSEVDIVSEIAKAYQRALALADTMEKEIEAINGAFTDLQEGEFRTNLIAQGNPLIDVVEIEFRAIKLLLRHAQSAFRVGANEPNIYHGLIPEHLRAKNLGGTAACTDHLGCWAWIETNFGGNLGVMIVRREAAQAIKKAMQEIKETKSGVKFKIDAHRNRNRNGRNYYSSSGRLQKFASDIMVAAEWMLEDDAQDSGNMHPESLIDVKRTFESYWDTVSFGTAEIFTMANGNMIQVTPRASAVEFKISHQTGERLQAFLAKYGDQQAKYPRVA